MKNVVRDRGAEGAGKRVLVAGVVSASLVAVIGVGAYAVPEKPGGSGEMLGQSAANVNYSGATTFSSDAMETGGAYGATGGGQNAILVSDGEVTLEKVTVNKTGDGSGENADFYGTNAGILVYNGGKLEISDATITTGGGYANAVFAYGGGKIEISGSTISTTGNNSGGIMVTGGGTLTAKNLKVETTGNSAAAIRSDRGGGTMTVTGGSYKTSGVGSPVIYSTANVTVNEAELEATASEGVVVEGANAVELDAVKVTDTNTTLNGQSETYKNIFIYQSMSGDAEEGAGTFTAKNSELTTNKGDTFYVTNTSAVINLTNNTYTNSGGGQFLVAQGAAWGTSGQNGGQVSLNLTNDEVVGGIQLDEISQLTLNLDGGSYLRGEMTGGTKNVKISDPDSVWVLEGDVELDFLEDADGTFQNVYSNGHSLKVNGETVAANTGTPPEHKLNDINNVRGALQKVGVTTTDNRDDSNKWIIWVVIGGTFSVVVVAAAIGVTVWVRNKKKNKGIKVTLDEDEKRGIESRSEDDGEGKIGGNSI